jgi:UDP-2-acetamido-2,6-beta-L-arabino-hexul-4-ose reductase
MKLLVTGANGFVGKNLSLAITEQGWAEIAITRDSSAGDLQAGLAIADCVIHLAGINRPQTEAEFASGNIGFTETLVNALKVSGRSIPVAFSSSIQAERDNPYGSSKRGAEEVLAAYGKDTGSDVAIFRLPNVFGKWCRPNYNSAVATFCHNIARGLPITINDPTAPLRLVYVDDVLSAFLAFARSPATALREVSPEYQTTVGEMAATLQAFQASRGTLLTEPVGTGLIRALYSTYLSYLPIEDFSYTVKRHADPRGVFVEMLKTKDSGQFCFFTAHPGVTRGGHYHHTKTEKFLVISGTARYKFRNMATGETVSLDTSGDESRIVETVPGWSHDITNIGNDLMVVMLWVNEVFDRDKPDTIAAKVF